MPDVVGASRNFLQQFRFVVEIDGVTYAGFAKAGPLEGELAVIEHYEGGKMIPNKAPGRAKVTNITLERGATLDRDLWAWWKDVADIAKNGGRPDLKYKRGLDIVGKNLADQPCIRWRVRNAWPCKFKAGEWDNDQDANVVESVELACDFWEPIEVAGALL